MVTPDEVLRDMGFSDEEILQIRSDGFIANKFYDPQYYLNVGFAYDDHGQPELAEKMYNMAFAAMDFYQTTVQEQTGFNVEFDLVALSWRDIDSGHFAPNPCVEVDSSQSNFESSIQSKYAGYGG